MWVDVQRKTWSFRHPTVIISGPGVWPDHCFSPLGEHDRTLLVTTRGALDRGFAAGLFAKTRQDRLVVWDKVRPNPDLYELDQAVSELMQHGVSSIIALGGGSVLDAAKVFSLTMVEGASVTLHDHFKHGRPFSWQRKLPLTAVPTTSGTGAEVTPFATVWDTAGRKKYSLSHEALYPEQALLDPLLTVSLPARETLHTGLDLVSHALESLWNKNANPVSQAFAWQALALANESLSAVLRQPHDVAHRTNMHNASMLAGMAISLTRTAIAHSISYPLTLHFGMPHGLACGFALPAIIRQNMDMFARSGRSRLVEQIQAMLLALDLTREAQQYASLEAMLVLTGEMVDPDRASNYPKPVDQDEIAGMLSSSMAG